MLRSLGQVRKILDNLKVDYIVQPPDHVCIPIYDNEYKYLIQVQCHTENQFMLYADLTRLAEIRGTESKEFFRVLLSASGQYCYFVIHSNAVRLKSPRLSMTCYYGVFQEFLQKVREIRSYLTAHTEEKHEMLVFPGRFQPPHKYHCGFIRRLISGDNTVIHEQSCNPPVILTATEEILICVSELYGDEKNPLSPQERIQLFEHAFNDDPDVRPHTDRISYYPLKGTGPGEIKTFTDSLPCKPKLVLTANTKTYQRIVDDGKLPVALTVRDWADGGATKIRGWILSEDHESLKENLCAAVYAKMAKDKLFTKIKNICGSK